MKIFFSHPMRPFFTAAAVSAIAAALGFFVLPNAVILHRQIFLEFMLPAAYGGFLFAAMPEWTGYSGSLKSVSRLSGSLLAAAFVLLFFHPAAAAWLAAVYWIVLFCFCVKLLWLGRNTANFTLLGLLAAFAAIQAAYAHTADLRLLNSLVHLNMAAVLFVSIRVSLLLCSEALKESSLKDPVFLPNAVYKNIAILFITAYAAAERWLPADAAGFAALAAGLMLLAKLRELHHWELLRKHYVRTYYAVQLFGAAGYLWLGYAKLANMPAGTPLHLITIGALLGAVLMVWLTAGLWHSGIARLDYPKTCRAAVLCLASAALARTALLPFAPALFATAVPALLLAAAFALWLYAFIPVFRARPFTADPE